MAAKNQERYVVAIARAPNSSWARVAFGKLIEQRENLVVLGDARQALYYDPKSGGEFGLAAFGPGGESRITGAVERAELSGFEGLLMTCSSAAVAQWQSAPVWRK